MIRRIMKTSIQNSTFRKYSSLFEINKCINHEDIVDQKEELIKEDNLKKNETQIQVDKKCSINKEVQNYLKNTEVEYFINYIPKALLRRNNANKTGLYLVSYEVAELFISMIAEDLLQNSSCVIECNPGLGLLTEKLLDIGIPIIYLYEKHNIFLNENSPLCTLNSKYNNRLQIKSLNFFQIWMTLLYDKVNNESCANKYLSDIPRCKSEEDKFVQIIAFCSDKFFLSMVMHNFYRQTNIFTCGQPAFYIAVPSIVWRRFSTNNTDATYYRYYTHFSVMFHLFFDYKYYGELPRSRFIPWPRVTIKPGYDNLDVPMCAVKIELKKNIFDTIEKDDLKPFWFFLKFGFKSQKHKVIMELEKLVPGCGIRLIKFGINICTLFKEMPPEKMLKLFKEFKSWPEYDEDLFISNAQKESDKLECEGESE